MTIRERDAQAGGIDAEVETVLDGWREDEAERQQEQTESMVEELISEHRADRQTEQS